MITFRIATPDELNEINSFSDCKYPVSAVYMVGADENGIYGYCAFTLDGESAMLLNAEFIKGDNEYVLKTICKAAFNLIDLSGTNKVYCENENIKSILDVLGFSKANGKYFLSLDGYFKPCSECK